MNQITTSNITLVALLALKPKAFWSLESDVLTASIPLLVAEKNRLDALAARIRDNGGSSYDRDQAWELSWKLQGWIEKAQTLPKKRILDAEKAERARLKAEKQTAKADHVTLVTPAANLIIASLQNVASYIQGRHYRYNVEVYKAYVTKFEAFLAENPATDRVVGTAGNEFTVRSGKSWYDFTKSLGRNAEARRQLLINDKNNEYQTPAADLKRLSFEDAVAILQREAKEHADFVVATYAFRVATRTIERHHRATGEKRVTITASNSDNNEVWDGALITVTAGAHQYQFNTKAIVNFSKYGKAFNQFPTREVASKHEDASTLGEW